MKGRDGVVLWVPVRGSSGPMIYVVNSHGRNPADMQIECIDELSPQPRTLTWRELSRTHTPSLAQPKQPFCLHANDEDYGGVHQWRVREKRCVCGRYKW